MPRFLTPEGRTKIKQELERLKEKKPQIAARIKAATELGDLSENAEFSTAKEDLALTEARIKDLQNLLRNAEIIKDKKGNQIDIGSTITLKINQEIKIYTLVGREETDPSNGRISYESPIGEALLKKKINEIVSIETPKGKISAKIIKIE